MSESAVVSNILEQVGNTTIDINTHTQGHFISRAQLRALKDALGFDDFGDTDSGEEGAIVESELATLKLQKAKLQKQLASETNKPKRTNLNLDIQQLESRIAKLNKVL